MEFLKNMYFLNANAGSGSNAQLKCIWHMHDIEIRISVWIVIRSEVVNQNEIK